MKKVQSAILLALFSLTATAAEPAKRPMRIEIQQQKGGNFFAAGNAVKFDAIAKGLPAGNGEAKAVVTNFFGVAKTFSVPVQSKAGSPTVIPLDFGTLDPGYYDLKVTLALSTSDGKTVAGDSTTYVTRLENPGEKRIEDTDPFSFAVVSFVDRTAQQARQQGSRFGLKLFQIGSPGVWWRRDITYKLDEIVDATARLGLQWTRAQFNQGESPEPGMISTTDLVTKHAMNSVMKIEGFPEHCWDEARYGTLEAWKAKNKKVWNRCTVPLKEPYQKWLKEEITKLPADQDIFEIGNEVWDYMSAPEFAEWAIMTREAVKQVRPDAKIGADPGGRYEYATAFMNKGGMEGMDIVYIHPYSFTPLPEHRTRPQMRNLVDQVRQHTGKKLDIYVTEYGWPTAAKDSRKHSVSEVVQAQRTVRQSVMMYAEDVKTLIPHWMADREFDVTERENWFGFFRLSGQPKPVLIAHAVSARMIDGSRFIGDIWNGPGLASMLFERNGEHTLVLWTAEAPKEAEVDVGVPEITVVDIVGNATKVKTEGGKLRRTFDASAVYLVGVSPSLASRAVPPDQDLNPDLWSTRTGEAVAHRATSIQIDGDPGEWSNDGAIKLQGDANVGQAEVRVRWDDQFAYVSMNVTDKDMSKPGVAKISIGAKPDRQQSSPTMYDYLFAIRSEGGAFKAYIEASQNTGPQIDLKGEGDPTGIRWAAKASSSGWTAEMAVPIAFMKGFPAPKPDARVSCRFAFEKGKAYVANGDSSPRVWSYLRLKD